MKNLIKLSRELVENLLNGNKQKLGKEYFFMFSISKFVLLKEKILKYSIPNEEGSKTSVVIRLFLSEASQLMFLLINNLKSEEKTSYDYYDLLTKNRQIKEEL